MVVLLLKEDFGPRTVWHKITHRSLLTNIGSLNLCMKHSTECKTVDNSNKSPTRCNNFSSTLFDVYLQLNIFRASSRGDSSAVGRGRPGHDQQYCDHHAPKENQRLLLQLLSS
jgi:hypothetical protein